MQKIIIGALVGIIIVGGTAFYAGVTWSKNQTPSRVPGSGGQFGGTNFAGRSGAGARGGAGFTAGEILATDTGSITIKLQDGSTKIVLLASSTQIMKATAGTLSDLSVGQQVMVSGAANSDGSLTAQSVQLRPRPPAGQGAQVSR